ncbi:enamine deaminase RidA [Candidatus Entotheonella serta]|nr:enamine deaminase RidA [Candidatus Entotheonella serta]
MRLLNTALLASILFVLSALTPTNATAQKSNVKLTIVNPAGLYNPAPNGYSHAIVAEGGARLAFIAGQSGEDPTGALSLMFAEQVKQAYANLRTALDAVGAKPHQVAKITTYVVDYDQSMLGVMTQHVQEMFGDSLPTQTLVPVPRLALDGLRFEVEAIAVLDSSDNTDGNR